MKYNRDEVVEIAANIDDMTGEDLAFAMERIMEKGALDVCAEPVFMKKGRPGYKLLVLIKEDQLESMAAVIFKHTSTIGIRLYRCERLVMERDFSVIEKTLEGGGFKEDVKVNIKESYLLGDFEVEDGSKSNIKNMRKVKLEFDDLAEIARELDISLEEVRELLRKQ